MLLLAFAVESYGDCEALIAEEVTKHDAIFAAATLAAMRALVCPL